MDALSQQPRQERQRIDFLDALRGVAAMAVVISHCLARLVREGHDWAYGLADVMDFGKFGVALFFMISGFVIPFSFRSTSPLTSFAISRAVRLLPALWLSIATALLLGFMPGTASPAGTIASNMLMIAQPLGFELISLPYWTLQWELGFYLLCGALFASGKLADTRTLGLAMFACAVVALIFPKCAYLGFMFAGSLARQGWWEGNRQARKWTIVSGIALGTAITAWCLGPNAPTHPFGFAAAMILAALVFAAALKWRPKTGAFLQLLGTLSYSIYLFHPQVLALATRTIGPLSSTSAIAAFIIYGLAGSVLVAWPIYRLLEHPMQLWGKKLMRRSEVRAVAT